MFHMLTISQLKTVFKLLRRILLEILLDILLSWVLSKILRGLDRLVGMLGITKMRTFSTLNTCVIDRGFMS